MGEYNFKRNHERKQTKDIEENQYNFADLDRNRDGKIDLITVIYKNTTQNISVGWNSPLWDYHSYSNMISVQEGVILIRAENIYS